MHSHGHKTAVFVKMNSYNYYIRMGALINKTTFEGGAYSKGGLIGRRALN